MKLFRFLAVAGIAVSAASCGDLEVVNLNDPDRERAISTPTDVEALIAGSFSSWWTAGHYSALGIPMSTMADAHSSSWGNFAMRELSSEPRIAYNNDPAASYAYVTRNTWRDSYRALSGVRDGLLAIEGGVDLGAGGANNHRAQTFGALVQALSLARLAKSFDQGFIIDENTSLDDPNALPQLQPASELYTAAIAKFDQAISMAGTSFTIPSTWVGDGGDWSNTRLAQIAHGYKAKLMVEMPRSEAERAAVNWNNVLTEANAAHTVDFNVVHDDVNWAWDRLKVHGGANDGWARLDYQFVGPADQSGKWEEWRATAVENRQPFYIDTDDRRVTGGPGNDGAQTDGLYVRFLAGNPFRPERGTYHFSNYSDNRWYQVYVDNYVGTNGVFPVAELDFIKAEAMYRTGNQQGALDIINQYRTTNGQLPPATLAGDQSARCVPQSPTGQCGDLWEVLKYEKRMETWHYEYGTEFFDDRGWGDLVSNTPIHFPVPGSELDVLLLEIYTFGGGGEGSAPKVFTNLMDESTIGWKKGALDAYDDARMGELSPGVIR
jgi:hypothetical protein